MSIFFIMYGPTIWLKECFLLYDLCRDGMYATAISEKPISKKGINDARRALQHDQDVVTFNVITVKKVCGVNQINTVGHLCLFFCPHSVKFRLSSQRDFLRKTFLFILINFNCLCLEYIFLFMSSIILSLISVPVKLLNIFAFVISDSLTKKGIAIWSATFGIKVTSPTTISCICNIVFISSGTDLPKLSYCFCSR